MSSKSKKPSTPAAPKPRFTNGTKVFICCYAFSGPGKILQGEITRADSYTHPIKSDSGKITGNETFFSYIVSTSMGSFEVHESQCYATYLDAAKEFGKTFVEYLK
jgi:hypothetical protein